MEIHNVAPNGEKTEIITLIEVPNADNSGIEYKIFFQEYSFFEKKEIGKVELINGTVRFSGGTMTYLGLKLLADWIEKNLEDLGF